MGEGNMDSLSIKSLQIAWSARDTWTGRHGSRGAFCVLKSDLRGVQVAAVLDISAADIRD